MKTLVVIAFCAICTVKSAMNVLGLEQQFEEQETRR